MPLIEYRCAQHGEFEILHAASAIRETPEKLETHVCPECGHKSPRHWAGQTNAVIYKGNWFKTKGTY